MKIAIESITIGERIRKDFGDLRSLAESIQDLGLLQPIGITPHHVLVFGERRLRAVRDILGWTDIPARIVNIESIVLGEHAENELRKDFTVSERVAIGKLLEDILGERRGRPAEKENSENFNELKGKRTDELAAEKSGFGNYNSYRQAKEVVEKATPDLVRAMDADLIPVSRAAKLIDAPPEFQKAVVRKLETGEASKPTEAIRQVKKETLPVVTLPSSKYRVLYADPPWKYGDTRDGLVGYSAAADHYPTMSLDELCALPIRDIAEVDAVLFLWVTSPLLEDCFPLIRAWGFQYKASFVWDKVKHNIGHYNSVRHEFLLVCTRGSCTPDVHKLFDSVQTIERTTHSAKPEEFRKIIETLYPYGKRLELFARQEHESWEVYGNQL